MPPALCLPGGADHDQFSNQARWVYYVLNDFGAFIGWLGVVIAAAMAWLGLRDKLVSAWLGIVSLIPVVIVLAAGTGLAIAGFPGVVGPIWLIAFAGLVLGRQRI